MYAFAEWWADNGHDYLTPRDDRFAEGYHPGELALGMLKAWGCAGHVLELGCGDGRLAEVFPVDAYTGLDVNIINLENARHRLPAHDFELYHPWEPWPESDAVIAWTVLIHVPDEELGAFAERCLGRWVLIGECMSRAHRGPREPTPMCNNRDPTEYLAAMPMHRAAAFLESPIARYAKHGPPRDSCHVMLLRPI